MTTTTAPAQLFAGIDADHPFGAALSGFRDQLAGLAPTPGQLISSEIKGRRTANGWELDRFYSSVQCWTGDPARPFTASTLYWTARAGRAEWFHFPAEPYLVEAAAWLHPPGHASRPYEVLRYVPLRRLTVRTGLGGRAIVKFKRRSRLLESWTRVGAVAAATCGTPVRVPSLVALDNDRSAYIQLAVDGPSLDQLVTPDTVTDLFGQAGRVHAEFHALRCADLPVANPAATTDAVVHDADWLAAQRPAHAAALGRIRADLLARVPDPAGPATCHGDLVPSHLIGGDNGWSVIDLDLAHVGDPHRDVAVFLAGMPAEVGDPGFVEAAQQAYLAGYAETCATPLDPAKLAWHRVAAQLHQLAVAAAKDRLPGTALQAGMDHLLNGPYGRSQ